MATSKRRPWEERELILALELYSRTPFGKIHKGNPEIIAMAEQFGRTPSSVGLKLANFASIDPTLDRKGLSRYSKLDKDIWDRYFNDLSPVLLQNRANPQEVRYVQLPSELPAMDDPGAERMVRTRLRQQHFRKTILQDYNHRCCVTELPVASLLVASHIVPWAKNETNRVNPRNGLCLNALHDRAFDKGLITIDERYKVVLSKELQHQNLKGTNYIQKTEGRKIQLPKKFKPDQQFLEYHREHIFAA